ncbi:O-antigen ligase family protein [Bacillus timonensis]|nr:O-antigen ligase family protein [Bacillus timonensis]
MDTLLLPNKKIKVVPLVAALILALIAGIFSTLPTTFLPLIAILIGLMLFLPISVERIFLLIALTIFIDVSFITIKGSYLRIYQVLFLTLFLKYLLEFFLSKREIALTPLFLLINLWVLSYFLAYGHIISVTDFWTSVIGQLFLNVFYFVSVQCIRENGLSFFYKVLKFTILSGFFISILGIFQWIGFFVGINVGISHYEAIGLPRPSSFAHEPDWYGLFAAYTATWFVALFIRRNSRLFSREFIFIGVVVCSIAIFISMTRAAILAFGLSFIFLFFITRNIRAIKLTIISILMLIPVVIVLFVVDEEMVNKVYYRFNPLTSLETDSGAANSRLASIEVMLDYIPKHPIVGNGSGGMAMLSQMKEIREKYIHGGELNAGKGNANIFLGIMFDTGLIGLLIFLLIIGRIAWMLRKSYEKSDYVSIGLIGASMMLLIDFNFNNGFRMGFVWFHLALVTSYYLLKQRQRTSQLTQEV